MLGRGAGHLNQRPLDAFRDFGLLLIGSALEPVDVNEWHLLKGAAS